MTATVWKQTHGLVVHQCKGERQTRAQRQKEAQGHRAQGFKQIHKLLSRSKLFIGAGSRRRFSCSMLQSVTQVIASNDVAVAVAGEYDFSEGGEWGRLNFSAT